MQRTAARLRKALPSEFFLPARANVSARGVAKGHARTRPLLEEIGFAPEMIASGDHAAHLIHSREEAGMTAYLISLALAGLVAIAVWEGFS